MTDAEILTIVKADIGEIILDEGKTAFLESCLSSAKAFIEREGVVLDTSSLEDSQLVAMYTAYLYRKRATQEPMPRMLRWALNNRVFGGVANGS